MIPCVWNNKPCDLAHGAPTSDTALARGHEHIILFWVHFFPCWIGEVVLVSSVLKCLDLLTKHATGAASWSVYGDMPRFFSNALSPVLGKQMHFIGLWELGRSHCFV